MGGYNVRRGVVHARVPAGEDPRDHGYRGNARRSRPRDHDSYLVRSGGNGGAIYWPKVGDLVVGSGR